MAEVYGQVLYESELAEMMPSRIEPNMQDQVREEIIEDWIQQQIIVGKAKSELKNVEKRIQTQLNKYRANLLMYEYEKYALTAKLDTVVRDSQIRQYYKDNIDDFELDDYLVQAIFIKASKDAPDLNKVNNWFRSNDTLKFEQMKSWSADHSLNFYFDNESWLHFDDVKKMLPDEMIYNKQIFIINRLARKYADEDYVYFFRILDFRTGISPLEFERNNIKSRILQMRISEPKRKN